MKRTHQRRLAAFERAENKKAAPRKGRNKIPLWAPAEARTLSAADVFEMTREADKLMSAAAAWRGQAGGI